MKCGKVQFRNKLHQPSILLGNPQLESSNEVRNTKLLFTIVESFAQGVESIFRLYHNIQKSMLSWNVNLSPDQWVFN